jgi:hypothetical protein
MGVQWSSSLQLIAADGIDYIAHASSHAFDLIVVDVAAVCQVRTTVVRSCALSVDRQHETQTATSWHRFM